jgi:hypothetical protein
VGILKYILRTGVLGILSFIERREGEKEKAIYKGSGQPRAPD